MQQVYFPWWSIATISRIAKRCEEKGLIHIGNFNKVGYDRTQWYCLNEVGIGRLKSIRMNDTIFQNEKSKRAKRKMDTDKMKNGSAQNETPIPETPAQTSPEIPQKLNTPEFLELWEEFAKNRTKIKKPLTDISIKRLWMKLDRYSYAIALEALEKAVEGGYQGIFPEGIKAGYTKAQPAPTQYAEEH